MPKKGFPQDVALYTDIGGPAPPTRRGHGIGNRCCCRKPTASPELVKRKPSKRKIIATGTALLLLVFSCLATLATNIRRALFTTRFPGGRSSPSRAPLRNSLAEMIGRTACAGRRDGSAAKSRGVGTPQTRNAKGVQWPGALPNTGRSIEGSKGVDIDSGTRSQHYGVVQRQRQAWLAHRVRRLREEISELPEETPEKSERRTEETKPKGQKKNTRGDEGAGTPRGDPGLAGVTGAESQGGRVSRAERIERLELGGELWNRTYVPPIEPVRRLELIDVLSGNAARRNGNEQGSVSDQKEDAASAQGGRILYVISSFDRGQRLGPFFKVDKLDFILMMMDEMREACELGFSPRVHLIAAWKVFEVEELIRDRLFCHRLGDYVPYSLEEHPETVKNDLSIKHRIFMKPRLEDFDVFIQVEDDVILTLNHIMLFQEESWRLDHRRRTDGTPVVNIAVPGFIRVEHLDGDGGTFSGPGSSGEEWLEWEVMLSRFRAIKLTKAGIYFTLGPSSPLPHGGNNQGMWMATREQLKSLSSKPSCGYLNFDESSTKGHVETLSGSIQMFRPNCGFRKVFPARQFEGFLVHHRANNKLGIRGESVPGVPISLLRGWVEQFVRDELFLKQEWNPPPTG